MYIVPSSAKPRLNRLLGQRNHGEFELTMRWLLRLIAALSLVSIACVSLLVMQMALPFDFDAAGLLCGIAVVAAFVAWVRLKDLNGQ